MVMSDDRTWMWLADIGAYHNITSKCDDFLKYRALYDRLWLKGISALVVGACSVHIIVKAENGEEILAVLVNVLHVPESSRRASWSYFLFARGRGHMCRQILSKVVEVLRRYMHSLCDTSRRQHYGFIKCATININIQIIDALDISIPDRYDSHLKPSIESRAGGPSPRLTHIGIMGRLSGNGAPWFRWHSQ
jgi:hypothetical protein